VRYETAEAFRQALEATLVREARDSGRPLAYLRKRVAFERFLVRIFVPASADAPFVLKGAFALGLRVRERRTTQDLDLALSTAAAQGDTDPVEVVREAAERDVGDFFQFRIGGTSEAHNQGLATLRLSVDARLAGRTFERFKLDLAMEVLDPASTESQVVPSYLEFAGMRAFTVRAIHPAGHYADKLHAYSRPRRLRSRVKDLVDLALLTLELEGDPKAPERIRKEVERVYGQYSTHRPWKDLPKPPSDWRAAFVRQAKEVGLEPQDMKHWFDRVDAYYRKLRPDFQASPLTKE